MKNIYKLRSDKPVAIWLLVGVLMIMVQIVLGGITRLTDSGLSITEWNPIMGSIPPISEKQWISAFEKYKEIAQYKSLHYYFTLEDFKSIFFWEWLHRLWGRLIGIVFLIPFLVFLKQRRIHSGMIKPMIILFLLGALQAIIGWLMVKSGLNEEDIYVSHIRLSVHFIAALGLLIYTFWFALQLMIKPQEKIYDRGSKQMITTILCLLVVQLFYGAFMAGLKAATMAPTWPDINGKYVPDGFRSFQGRSYSFFSSIVNNPITVQFIHRNLAYLIFILIVVWTIKNLRQRKNALFNKIKWLPVLLVSMQVLLGVFAILSSPKKIQQHWGLFEWNAQLHQFLAMLLLLSLILILFLFKGQQKANSTAAVEPKMI